VRVLADENFPGPLILAMRDQGHDVLSAKESMRGATDRAVLERAQTEERVVLTFDKDFGELAFHYMLPASSGVVLFRLEGSRPESDNARALSAFLSRDDWPGQFSVVTDTLIRMRPLPSRRSGGDDPDPTRSAP
jgi:predicted nuclease of predicted toxin-antitoxin system